MAAVDVERGVGWGVRVPDVGSVRCTRWYTVDCIVASTLVDRISCTRRFEHSVPKLHFCKVLRAGSWCVWLQRPAVLVAEWCERQNIDRVTACSWLSFRFTCGCPSGLASNQGTVGVVHNDARQALVAAVRWAPTALGIDGCRLTAWPETVRPVELIDKWDRCDSGAEPTYGPVIGVTVGLSPRMPLW